MPSFAEVINRQTKGGGGGGGGKKEIEKFIFKDLYVSLVFCFVFYPRISCVQYDLSQN